MDQPVPSCSLATVEESRACEDLSWTPRTSGMVRGAQWIRTALSPLPQDVVFCSVGLCSLPAGSGNAGGCFAGLLVPVSAAEVPKPQVNGNSLAWPWHTPCSLISHPFLSFLPGDLVPLATIPSWGPRPGRALSDRWGDPFGQCNVHASSFCCLFPHLSLSPPRALPSLPPLPYFLLPSFPFSSFLLLEVRGLL